MIDWLPSPSDSTMQRIRAELQFCCNGCRLAWQLLHEYGLDDFYSLCEEQGTSPLQPQSTGHDFSEFDDPVFLQNHVRNLPDGLMETRVLIEGIRCAACIWLIEKLPRLSKGVVEIRVSLGSQTATIRWQAGLTTLAQIARQLGKIGYRTHPRYDGLQEALHRKQTRQQLLHLAVAGACAGNAMLLAFALYGGLFGSMAAEHLTVLRYASALVGMISLAWPGGTFFRGAWRALVNRTPHMDISLALGLAAGGIMGTINTLRGTGEIYFDSLCMLVFVLLIGRFFQYRQQRRASESVALLRNLMPRTAHRVDEKGQIRHVHIDALRVGDLVEVHPGDLVPADGVIETGISTLDQSLLTGESAGIVIKEGQAIPAGSTNLSAVIRMRIAAVGRATRIGKLMELVEAESVARIPLVELANRVSGYFLRVVLVLAVLTLVLWAGSGVDLAIDHAIALLIVACPCALGLATPLTIAVAQGHAARQSILIRSGEVFERLKRPGMLWLDKTGTVTEGRMTLRAWHGDQEVMPHVLAIEQNIVHPLADCLVKSIRSSLADSDRWAAVPCQKQVYEPGRGVRGVVGGKAIVVGSREFLEINDIDLKAEASWPIEETLQQGWTPIYIGCGGQLVAVAAVGDSIRSDAAQVIKTLRDMSWKVGLLSGDHPDVVRRIAAQLNIPEEYALGGVMPEDKLALVRSTPAGTTVVMVGDGVNDAAALAAADVGVAVHGGAEASLLAAPVYLGRSGLMPLVELLQGSRRALGAIRNGLLVSLSYNILAISLAMAGYITPLVAAILMPISSLTVTILAVLQRSFRRLA